MTPDLAPLLNKSALLKLGWTPALIQAILGNPALVKHRSRGAYKWVEHLYARDKVLEGMKHHRFLELQEARKSRASAAVQKKAAVTEKYSSWQEALPEACAGMLSLNRYAKHRRCSALQRVEIYQLKGQLIELLYKRGYSTACFIHQLHQETQFCRVCGGAGDWDCSGCDGDGVRLPARTQEFWCFEFQVAGTKYCWHQPRALLQFSPVETVPPVEWERSAADKEKALLVRQDKFSATKQLLGWLIDQAQRDSPVHAG